MLKKINILGLGNLLMSDEGFGVHCIRYLHAHYDFSAADAQGFEIQLVDAGTGGMVLGPYLEDVDRVILIDVIAEAPRPSSSVSVPFQDKDSGQAIYHFTDANAFRRHSMQTAMSPHQVGILEVFELSLLRGNAARALDFFCTTPRDLSLGVQLSPKLQALLPQMAEQIVSFLKEMSVPVVSIDAPAGPYA
ncbi:MAG: hydrogenase maturation protease [Deltaproteobacteria bacterium]|jgi:hydrogenase maturation protease|nr:hydrogenase maturation protease [Deltaproteobacteria bacterium]